jgi:hypothetical protein
MFIGTEQSKYVVHFQSYDVTTIRIGSDTRDFKVVVDTGKGRGKFQIRTGHVAPNWE